MGRSILLDNKRPGKSLKVVDIYPEEQNIEIQFSSLDYQNRFGGYDMHIAYPE